MRRTTRLNYNKTISLSPHYGTVKDGFFYYKDIKFNIKRARELIENGNINRYVVTFDNKFELFNLGIILQTKYGYLQIEGEGTFYIISEKVAKRWALLPVNYRRPRISEEILLKRWQQMKFLYDGKNVIVPVELLRYLKINVNTSEIDMVCRDFLAYAFFSAYAKKFGKIHLRFSHTEL